MPVVEGFTVHKELLSFSFFSLDTCSVSWEKKQEKKMQSPTHALL
jgi:hypothetical protein